jgi:hypothetical protein
MAKFDVTVVRAVKQTATVQVEARDKRSAALVAGPLLADAKWSDEAGNDQKIASIEKVPSETPSTGHGGRKKRAA